MTEIGVIDMEDEETMWTRNFEFGGIHLRVEEEWGIGIGGTVWEGGVLLASFLSSNLFPAELLFGGRCLELGAGVTALPSLVAFHRHIFNEVVVTDIAECIEALEANVEMNLPSGSRFVKSCSRDSDPRRPCGERPAPATSQELGWDIPSSVVEAVASSMASSVHLEDPPERPASFPNHFLAAALAQPALLEDAGDGGARSMDSSHLSLLRQRRSSPLETVLRIEELDWRDNVDFLKPPFDVLLIADVVYIAELMRPLIECMVSLVNEQTLVYLAYYERSAAAAEEFWTIVPDYFTYSKVQEQGYGMGPHPSEVGVFQLRLVPEKDRPQPGQPLRSHIAEGGGGALKMHKPMAPKLHKPMAPKLHKPMAPIEDAAGCAPQQPDGEYAHDKAGGGEGDSKAAGEPDVQVGAAMERL